MKFDIDFLELLNNNCRGVRSTGEDEKRTHRRQVYIQNYTHLLCF